MRCAIFRAPLGWARAAQAEEKPDTESPHPALPAAHTLSLDTILWAKNVAEQKREKVRATTVSATSKASTSRSSLPNIHTHTTHTNDRVGSCFPPTLRGRYFSRRRNIASRSSSKAWSAEGTDWGAESLQRDSAEGSGNIAEASASCRAVGRPHVSSATTPSNNTSSADFQTMLLLLYRSLRRLAVSAWAREPTLHRIAHGWRFPAQRSCCLCPAMQRDATIPASLVTGARGWARPSPGGRREKTVQTGPWETQTAGRHSKTCWRRWS